MQLFRKVCPDLISGLIKCTPLDRDFGGGVDVQCHGATLIRTEKMFSKLYWETVRCSSLIRGRSIGWWVVGVQVMVWPWFWPVTFFAVTLTYKISSGLYLRNCNRYEDTFI